MIFYKKECPICYEKTKLIKTSCNHKICKVCITKCINNYDIQNCPFCRKKLKLRKKKSQIYFINKLNYT